MKTNTGSIPSEWPVLAWKSTADQIKHENLSKFFRRNCSQHRAIFATLAVIRKKEEASDD